MHLAQHTFLISGGSSGLGAATAARLVAGGANVVLGDVNHRQGEQVAETLGMSARFHEMDVTSETSVKAAVQFTLKNFGGLHGAICCAGIVHGERVVGRQGPHSQSSFERVIDVNLNGTFNVMRIAAAAMADNLPNTEGERGVLIGTASVAAFEGQLGQAAYAASKAAVAGMVLPMARELARLGIRVMAIAPGIFDTPMFASLPAATQESLAAQVPFPPRAGRPEEYALLVQQIIENPMLNGSTVRLDGGIRMGAK